MGRSVKRSSRIALGLACSPIVASRSSEQSNDYAELGAVLNGFSLTETGSLSAAIERSGQAVDATYLSTTNLVSDKLISPRPVQRATST